MYIHSQKCTPTRLILYMKIIITMLCMLRNPSKGRFRPPELYSSVFVVLERFFFFKKKKGLKVPIFIGLVSLKHVYALSPEICKGVLSKIISARWGSDQIRSDQVTWYNTMCAGGIQE